MIVIVNISPPSTPNYGQHEYEVRINNRVITTFMHDRKVDGLAQCLRDAADSVDRQLADDRAEMVDRLLLEFARSHGPNSQRNP